MYSEAKARTQNIVLLTLTTLLMNIKRIFGAVLTLLGIACLIYAAQMFLAENGEVQEIKSLITYAALGLIFFIPGISLVRTTKDEA